MRKVWIEAALNGPWSRRRQPGSQCLNRKAPSPLQGAYFLSDLRS
jgi:hypothetical protein